MIEFRSVTKIYETSTVPVTALEGVSLKIEDGEFVYVIGASGAGKSTLIKLLNCEERVTSGEIYLDGFRLHRIRRRQIPMLRRRIGMVFQDFKLIDSMNVYDNIAFALRVTECPARDVRVKVPAILRMMDLENKARCYPSELSGGQQQKVGIARAMVCHPSILIADEPTGNIDQEAGNEILQMLDEINKSGTTVIMVTHHRDYIKMMPRRVLLLEGGRLVYDEDLTLAQYGAGEGEEPQLELFNEPASTDNDPGFPVDSSILDSGFVPDVGTEDGGNGK